MNYNELVWSLGRRPRGVEPWKKTKRGGALEEDQEGWSLRRKPRRVSLGRRPRRQWACMEPWKKTLSSLKQNEQRGVVRTGTPTHGWVGVGPIGLCNSD